VYHSLYNKFCPKRLHFSYAGMIARSQLAVLDFNCGVELVQAKTREGKHRYKLQFSKITQSWVVKKVSLAKEKAYIGHLMDEVVHIRSSPEYIWPQLKDVPEYIAPIEKPDKEESIQNMKTRFSVSQ